MIQSVKVLAIAARIDRPETALFQALKQSGVGLHLVYDATDPSADALSRCGIPINHMLFRSRIDFTAIGRLRREIRDGAFEIVHTFTNRALSNALFASARIPVRHVTYRGTMGHLSRINPASWMTHLNPGIDRVVCVSDAVRKDLMQKGVPPERLVTIHKGHDPAWYCDKPATTRADLGLPDDAFVVGFVGRIRPVKGVDVLLRAAALLPSGLNVRLLLVGDIHDRRVRALVQDEALHERAHLMGHRKDAPALMRLCNAFVMPSVEREGLPRSVIEAMAQGIPPVVSGVGGMPELVIDGQCGRVVPPRDPEALAAAIRELAEDTERCAEYGERGRARITEQFNVSDYIKQTLELYRELV